MVESYNKAFVSDELAPTKLDVEINLEIKDKKEKETTYDEALDIIGK